MKTKKLLLTLGISAFAAIASHAQTYTVLTTDVSGDNYAGGVDIPDAAKLSYRYNAAGDSIFFKMEFYTDILPGDDLGLMLGLDTDQVVTNHYIWNGSNTSMKYDYGIMMFQNGMMDPGHIYIEVGDPSSHVPLTAATITQPDPKTVILGMKASTVDPDGKFNIVAGVGFFDIASTGLVNDEMPQTTYATVSKTGTSISDPVSGSRTLSVFPNPAGNQVSWDLTQTNSLADKRGFIYDIGGKIVHTFMATDGVADISALPAGIYAIRLGDLITMISKQ